MAKTTKYKLVHTGSDDVLFVGKAGSKNFIERGTGFHGDFSICMSAAYCAGFNIGADESDVAFVEKNFDALVEAAKNA